MANQADRRKKHRRLLFNQQGEKCFYCGHDCRLPGDTKTPRLRLATLDHIIPKSQGGGDGLGNLVMACMTCNTTRKDIDFHTFWEEELWRDQNRPRRQELLHCLDSARRQQRFRELQPERSSSILRALQRVRMLVRGMVQAMHKPTLIRTLKALRDDPLIPYAQRAQLARRLIQSLQKTDESLDPGKILRAVGFES